MRLLEHIKGKRTALLILPIDIKPEDILRDRQKDRLNGRFWFWHKKEKENPQNPKAGAEQKPEVGVFASFLGIDSRR